MDKKSILHLTTVTNVVAGAELLILELTRHQKEMFSDYQICVACIKSKGYFNERLDAAGIENYNLNAKKNIFFIFAFFKLVMLVKRKKTKIIHTHLFHGGIMGAFLKFFCPSVTLIHTRHYSDIYIGIKRNRVRYFLDKHLVNKTADVIIAISNMVEDTLVNEGVSKSKIVQISNGIPSEIDTDYEKLMDDKNKLLLIEINQKIMSYKKKYPDAIIMYCLGVFRKGKGQANVLNLMYELTKRNINALCVVVGDGVEKKRISGLIEKYELKDNVLLAGFQNHPYAFVEFCDIFLHFPDEEGFGLVVAEAMREKKIVIASRIGGIEGIVDDGVNGFLVSPTLISEQLACLEKIKRMSDIDKKEFLDKACDKFINNFTIDKFLKGHADLYKKILL